MAIEQDMQAEINTLKETIIHNEAELNKMQKALTSLRKDLSNKIKAKSLFLGEKLPKKIKKKKAEEVKLQSQ